MANERVKDSDELVEVKGVGDYTVKVYRREDCKYYCVVVYESDDESEVAGTTRAATTDALAVSSAKSVIEKDMKARR